MAQQVLLTFPSSKELATSRRHSMKYWMEYVKVSYDLIMESEKQQQIFLDHEVEAYVVHLFARNFERIDIASNALCLELMQAISTNKLQEIEKVADECLIVNSMPVRKHKWPSETYYQDLGTLAYGLARNYTMEKHFTPASRVLANIFGKIRS